MCAVLVNFAHEWENCACELVDTSEHTSCNYVQTLHSRDSIDHRSTVCCETPPPRNIPSPHLPIARRPVSVYIFTFSQA